eukprot:CAMPEP_0183704826 /NCGR_PEP_ID=MMETSP0737-20130205/2087_1 /TAXON_ID=385413 /ORGANISM="Thalassiosira miniscula, Strain CCMP1093" /LENGTH=341 /DNA_ID=CAMNT_0025931841 /DNA_START=228 /DNA_END=1253 /DNA_ORIENTATION=+
MATSLDALEALLQIRNAVVPKKTHLPDNSYVGHSMPVPNPLDPAQPHIIEGDTPTRTVSRQTFGSGAKSAFSSMRAMAPVVTTVPNPLATPLSEKNSIQHSSPTTIPFSKPLAPVSTQNKFPTHGFGTSQPTPMPIMSSDAKPYEAEIRSDKIRDALNSKSQRGKKRQNLSDLERIELTRTRNREHAKSTRMKKKARLQELLAMEKKYLLLQEKEVLDKSRTKSLIQFVESAGSVGGDVKNKDCIHLSKLKNLASQDLHNPEFSTTDAVALTAENSAMVKVSAHGTDLESGKPKTLSGVICVDFSPRSCDFVSISFYCSAMKKTSSSVGMFPSVSVLSFES